MKFQLKDIIAIRKIPFNLDVILGIFAVIGIAGAVFLVMRTSKELPSGEPIAKPASSVFKKFIAASGITEASSDNIRLSPIASGVVHKIHVKVGDNVREGTPLLTLDQKQNMADLELKHSQVAQIRATVAQAKAQMQLSKDKYDLAQKIQDKRAISQDDFLSRKNAYLLDQAAYKSTNENLKVAEKQAKASQVNLELLTIKAPIDCTILQVNAHPGEYAATGALEKPLMLLGRMNEMHIRIDIDENEAWRFRKGTAAVASLRGNSDIKFDLQFVRTEPFMVPKSTLTGDSTERVDTRVLQVIYAFDPAKIPFSIYAGQQVDVYIEVPE